MAARKDHFGCYGELFWLARGIRIEVTQNLPDVRFLNIRFLFLPLSPTPLPKRGYNAVSVVADEVWQYRTGGNLTIFDKDHDTAEEG